MKIQHFLMGAAFALAGCAMLPSVGPDYAEPTHELPALPLPDAGLPTTNLTAVGEYAAAEGAADCRVNITTNEIRRWWTRFGDPVLTSLVEEAVSNNLSFLMAQERLTAARWQLLGSYAAYYPHVNAALSP